MTMMVMMGYVVDEDIDADHYDDADDDDTSHRSVAPQFARKRLFLLLWYRSSHKKAVSPVVARLRSQKRLFLMLWYRFARLFFFNFFDF